MDLNELPEMLGSRAPNGSDPRIDGLLPSLVLEPEDAAATAEALAFCHQESMAVIPIGGGTRLELGNVPSRLDTYLMTSGLKGLEIDEHIPGDFTMAVRAGTTLGETQEYLKEFRQYLPLDVPHPDEATIGGIFALGEPGLRRRALQGGLRADEALRRLRRNPRGHDTGISPAQGFAGRGHDGGNWGPAPAQHRGGMA